MLDHIGITAADVKRSVSFYEAALKPLGIGIEMPPSPEMIAAGYEGYGFGEPGKPFFWVGTGRQPTAIHIAFAATNRAQVHAFYEAALASGGRDNGPPGPRPHYHPDYYAAFVFDPDGNNVEAVCHRPE